MRRKLWLTLAFVGWIIFVTFLSLYSFGDDLLPRFEIPYFDKVVHFGFYFVATILGILAFQVKTKLGVAYMVLALFAYGGGIEIVQQNYTTTRMGDVFDALANGLGAVVGGLILRVPFFSKMGLN